MKTFFTFLFFAVLFSCKTEKTNTELNSCKDNALAEVIYTDIFKQSQIYLSLFLSNQNPADTNIKFISTANPSAITFPFSLTVDFGSSDILGSDQKYRRGKLIFNVSAANYDATLLSLDKIVTTFDNFYYNQSNNVFGTLTLTNKGLNGKSNYTFSLESEKGIIMSSNGTMSWESVKTLELTKGASTRSNILDDTYSLTGSASGKDFKGTDFTANISSPMTVDPNCRYFITSGKMTVEPNKLDVRNLDYGPGACTGLVSVQIKEQTLNFSIQ